MCNQKLCWWQTAVLLLMFGLALTSIDRKSPTFDEQGFITRGLGYLRGENTWMRVGHPLGLNALNASLLAADETVALPTEHPSWQLPNFHRPSELFMWEIGNDVAHVIWLARLPTIWLGLLLAALVGRWARELSGRRWAGLLALGLLALDPNVLAHTRLATTDLGLAFGATLAGYTLWRFLKRPSWPNAIIAGIGFGLLQNSKFTAGLFVPLFALVILVYFGLTINDLRLTKNRTRNTEYGTRKTKHGKRNTENGTRNTEPATRHPPLATLTKLIIAYPAAAILTLWAAYGFQIGTLPADLPMLPQLAGLTVPLSHHLEQLLDIGGRLQKSTPAFLLGQYSDSGWWYYFPIAFALKTPLPTLLLLAAAATYVLRNFAHAIRNTQYAVDLAALLIPPLGYFAIALTTDINLGYRHLLPVLPFLFVFIAATLSKLSIINYQLSITNERLRITDYGLPLTVLPLLWLAIIALWLHPHYLAFFNVFAGGPDNGWQALVDSNIDWGQDLGALRGWMDDNQVERVWLSYFGEARPNYYGIDHDGLDSWPPRLMNPNARPFYPHDPAPGIYAISATNLQGVHFADHDQFAWFRRQEPIDKVGYSIFLYEVAARGTPRDLALSGVQLDELAPADFARLETNDVTPHWFDAAQSWLEPPGAYWLALGTETAVHPDWQPLLADACTPQPTTAAAYQLYQCRTIAPRMQATTVFFGPQESVIHLLAATGVPETAVVGTPLTFRTTLLNTSFPQPLQLFVHLVNANGQIVAQWDGLGAPWEGWRGDDLLLQQHTLDVPPDTPPGDYDLWMGIYHPQTGTRWTLSNGSDRFFLSTVTVSEEASGE